MTRETPTPNTSNVNANYSFQGFLRGWHDQQDRLLTEIMEAVAVDKADDTDEAVATELMGRALAHFEEYYEHKSRAASEDVFTLLTPTWCTPLECAFMWIAGFRPGVLLELVFDSVRNLSPRQTEVIHRLKRETRTEEKQISDEIARIQETVAAPPILQPLKDAARRSATEDQHLSSTTNDPIRHLKAALEEVVAKADTLRVSTAANVAEILVPAQGLRFLAAALRVQQGMSRLKVVTRSRCA